jgi:hypothetical protein
MEFFSGGSPGYPADNATNRPADGGAPGCT